MPVIMSRGVPIDPRMDFAFFPSKVLADPVGGQFPVPPFLADGAFGDGQYCRYLSCGEHLIGATERSGALPYSFPIGVRLLFLIIARLDIHGVMYHLLSVCAFAVGRAADVSPGELLGRPPWSRRVIVNVNVNGAHVALRA